MMGNKQPGRRHAVVSYPSHWLEHPEDLLSFIELPSFTRRWERLGLTDDDFQALQVVITLCPRMGAVMEGAGGLRKGRFVPPKSGRGKSGGYRVCYLYVEQVATVVLGTVYDKADMEDLPDDARAIIRVQVERVEQWLMSRPYRCRLKP